MFYKRPNQTPIYEANYEIATTLGLPKEAYEIASTIHKRAVQLYREHKIAYLEGLARESYHSVNTPLSLDKKILRQEFLCIYAINHSNDLPKDSRPSRNAIIETIFGKTDPEKKASLTSLISTQGHFFYLKYSASLKGKTNTISPAKK